MRILIVDDSMSDVEKIAEVIEGLGEIVICTIKVACNKMPPFKEIIAEVNKADLVLLDNNFGTEKFSGKDILPYCKNKVIGISSDSCLGPTNFYLKQFLFSTDLKRELRLLVESFIAKIGEV
jgi:hypothetical protein